MRGKEREKKGYKTMRGKSICRNKGKGSTREVKGYRERKSKERKDDTRRGDEKRKQK